MRSRCTPRAGSAWRLRPGTESLQDGLSLRLVLLANSRDHHATTSVGDFDPDIRADGDNLLVRDARHDERLGDFSPDVTTLVIHPIRFGEEVLGLLEVEHHKRHAYGSKDIVAMSTLAGQMATAIHIAELRRPLVLTVGQISEQVTPALLAALTVNVI